MVLAFAALIFSAVVRDIRLNHDWQFVGAWPEAGSAAIWAVPTVDLPHAARLEDDAAPSFHSFQGRIAYRKTIRPLPEWHGRRVALEFEGAMQVADIWVNREHRLTHTGGYLPFELDLTRDVAVGKPIYIEVVLDNRDNPTFPPGRPQNQLDFTYAGGLYRNVWLEVTDSSHISDTYAYSRNVSRQSAGVVVQSAVADPKPGEWLKIELINPSGLTVAEATSPAKADLESEIHIAKPALWELERPNLYRVLTTLLKGDQVVDQTQTRFGIRKLEFDHTSGFRINGRSLKLEGSNRHMGFPIIGNAASDAAQYREAKKLKGLGLNILRLSHYPQSPAFLDACDELGILVIDPIPGWQFFRNTPEFTNHVLSDVRETVTRDRNHPCVAIFETCLNETYSAPDEFWRSCSQLAHQTFGQGNFFTGGDSYGKHDYSRPLWDVPWTGWDDATFSRPALFKMQMGLDREYGDYEFGGEQSTSRAGRDAGEGALMLQAWNFIWSHNRNRGNSWSFGDLTWEAIDTYRGMNPTSPVSKSGMLDLFRVPKPVAFFYESQGITAPMVHIANEWSERPSPTKVVVFSNCDEVALVVNGKQIARQRPDSGPTTGYLGPKVADPMYWAHGKGEIVPATTSETPVGGSPGALPFSGGNCRNLAHPPFTFFGVPYQAGRVEAVGYRNGRVVARDTVYTPGPPVRVVLKVDTQGRALEADGADFVFVYASVVDAHGQVVPSDPKQIQLSVRGGARVLGAEKRTTAGGIAAFMVQAGRKEGMVTLEATASGLRSDRVTTPCVVEDQTK